MNLSFALFFEAHPWYDYPGIELWKFVNLGILCVGIYFLVTKIVIPGLAARRETIREELSKAQRERDAATAKLAEVEERLARLDADTERLKEQARVDAEREGERIRLEAEAESQKLRDQARREIENAGKVARHQLRRFAADESVRLAESLIRENIRPEDDENIMELEVAELGGKR